MKHLILAIAWIWVAAPLSWGVYQSVQKSLPLFVGPAVTEPDKAQHSPASGSPALKGIAPRLIWRRGVATHRTASTCASTCIRS